MKTLNLKSLLVSSIVSLAFIPNVYSQSAKQDHIEIAADNLSALNSIDTKLAVVVARQNENREIYNEIRKINITLNKILEAMNISMQLKQKDKNNTEQIKVSAQPHPMNQLMQKETGNN